MTTEPKTPEQPEISEESIKNMVDLVSAAEVLSKTIDCSVSRAVEIMLRSMKALQIVSKIGDKLRRDVALLDMKASETKQ